MSSREAEAPRAGDGGGHALAVGALISAVMFAPLGVVLGVIALGRLRRSGQSGQGLAIAAIVLGTLVSVGLLLLNL